jgi:hypothetical protein
VFRYGFAFSECAAMFDNPDKFDDGESLFERRSVGRTKIQKDALLFFSEQNGVHSCTVLNVTNLGAGICVQNLPVLPLKFAMSFDNFRTVRMCRLIWRQGDFLGVAFGS